ncbi:class A beta-lactamase [Pseudomonas capeferrum]|uniref:class A beta-lactamase n=1 Tax=Pseudomonas capeferrum TaxID=1495066 RepID=UPI001C611A7D|nr:class A beta-lactamase [Pseudomonas capeferrum]
MKTINHVALIVTLLIASVIGTTSVFASPVLGEQLGKTAAQIEQRTGGRLGISVTDLASDTHWSYKGDQRFPLASTFKAFACASLLSQADRGKLDLGQRMTYTSRELDSYSPVTRDHADGPGLSLSQLCDAAMSMSDNTAANLVLKAVGGPAGLTAFMRSIGDGTTRVDRYEPELNNVSPGDPRDTTSPIAAAQSLRALLLGNVLSETSRQQFEAWLVDNKVSAPLFRASLPGGWKIADRTGASEYGSRGIIAVIWPTGDDTTHGPVVVAVYLTGTRLSLEERNTVLAEVGAALVRDLKPL